MIQMSVADSPRLSERVAGVALLIAGVSYLALLLVLAIASRGRLPTSGHELLGYLVVYGQLVQVAMALFIVKDVCILVALPIMAQLMGGIRRPALWVGSIIASLAMILDIISGLIVIASRDFANDYAAASPLDKNAYLPTAELIFRYVWRVETPLVVGLLSLAVLLFSSSMRSDQFGRFVPRAGLLLGAVGIVGALFGVIQPILLLSIWYIAVAFKLLLTRPTQRGMIV